MNVYFNVSPGNMHGKIEKEVRDGPLDGLNISIPVDEARALWDAGKITDCNLAFRRLATEHDFDVRACLNWYKAEAKADRERQEGIGVRHDPQPGDDEPLEDPDRTGRDGRRDDQYADLLPLGTMLDADDEKASAGLRAAQDRSDALPHRVFRELTVAQVASFETWADENYVPGSEISDLWHPVVRARCSAINDGEPS